mgnify:CR=1 FL=1
MSQLEPSTTIRLFSGIRLNNKYHDTIYFSSLSNQNSFFSNPTFILTNQSYQRVSIGKLRINLSYEQVSNCNYLSFQNSAFSDKWIYCFITDISYISNNVCEIIYEIDVLQTYMFDITIPPCFVEREISETDAMYEHLETETIEYGPIVGASIRESNDGTGALGHNYFEDYVAMVFLTNEEPDIGNVWNTITPGLQLSGVINGFYIYIFDISTAGNISHLYSVLENIQKGDGTSEDSNNSIIDIRLFPKDLIFTPASLGYLKSITIEIEKPTKIQNSYVPRNKKLLQYPYTYLTLTDGILTNDFNFEFFSSNKAYFTLTGVPGATNPSVVCSAGKYKTDATALSNPLYNMTIQDFPKLSYLYDTYQDYIKSGGFKKDLANGIISSGGLIASAFTGNVAGAVGGTMGLLNSINNFTVANSAASQAKGSTSADTLYATGKKQFYFITNQITEEYARIIDDYFDRYGYVCRRIKQPNISSRPSWNYTKTNGCNVYGNVPNIYLDKIANIYDAGITYWKNGNLVGNYSQNNKV